MARLINNKIVGGFDSITYCSQAAVTAHGGWRTYLFDLLKPWMGMKPRFVGRQHAFGFHRSGNKMIGTTGLRGDEVLAGTYAPERSFRESQPGLLILLGPMNDYTQLNSGAWVGGSIAASVANREILLDRYRQEVPEGIVLDCSCTPNGTPGAEDQIVLGNAANIVARDLRSDRAYIIDCDLHAKFLENPTWATDYLIPADNTHPSLAGHDAMADKMFEVLSANITLPTRFPAPKRKAFLDERYALRLTTEATPPTLGTNFELNTATHWAVNFRIKLNRQRNGENGILCLKTDQSTPFIFITFGNVLSRAFEFGSNTNFARFFVDVLKEPGFGARLYKKGFIDIGVIYRGGGRTSGTNYDLVIGGRPYTVSTGAGFGASTDENALGTLLGGGADKGIFDINNLAIWNGGSAGITVQQMIDFQMKRAVPSGPTMVRWYKFQSEAGAGSVLVDSLGNENGAVNSATWVSHGDRPRALASARDLAQARDLP